MRMHSMIVMCLFMLICCSCPVKTAEDIFNVFVEGKEEYAGEGSPFTDMVYEHEKYCIHNEHECRLGHAPGLAQSCCGSCTCDPSCYAHGSCCLQMYESFDHARKSVQESRYSCVSYQFLHGVENTDFLSYHVVVDAGDYWMITMCDPDVLDSTYTCESDDSDYDSLIPVTDPLTNIHYRSKNCALCNIQNSTGPLLYWKLGIQSNIQLSFPHDHIFEVIRRTRGNIFFIPPDYISAQICEPVSYTIDKCNATGLWKTYDQDIQSACESFVDPYNNTYKNIFCLKCNGDEDSMRGECQFMPDMPLVKEPVFAAILDMSIIRNRPRETSLICGDSQFLDEIMMTCRDILCQERRSLHQGICESSYGAIDDTCFSLFLKLTPVSGQGSGQVKLRKRDIQTFYFLKDFLSDVKINSQIWKVEGTTTSFAFEFSTGHGPEMIKRSVESNDEVLQKLRLFYKTDDDSVIQYLVIQLIYFARNAAQKYDILVNIKPFMSLSYRGELTADFSVELASFRFRKIDDGRTVVSIPHHTGEETDELVTELDIPYGNECQHDNDDITELKKIHWCPFVILNLEELKLRFKNDILTIFDNDELPRTIKVLSKWEYDVHNGSLYLCFQDYIELYYARFSTVIPEMIVSDSAEIISNALQSVWLSLVYMFLIAN